MRLCVNLDNFVRLKMDEKTWDIERVKCSDHELRAE